MAQAEDTELRDLVVEALEKNGSLAKIRALLRANIFLAFEDECEKPKQNESLDKILNLPEGKLSLCIIHEFLEFCNLKNTLFVYMSETRQGKEYTYRKEDMLDKLHIPKLDRNREPALLTIVKNAIKLYSPRRFSNSNDKQRPKGDNTKDEQNCTYIVHEDTSSSSQSPSDNSSDEKNKINLRLPLDNSDTDTSSDSARDKNRSEYIPNSQNLIRDAENDLNKSNNIAHSAQRVNMGNMFGNPESKSFHEIKNFNSSTESTSYMELRPLHSLDEVLLNTSGLPISENDGMKNNISPRHIYASGFKNESVSPVHTISSNPNRPAKRENSHNESPKKIIQSADDSGLNDTETMEYSYDFSPPNSEQKISSENKTKKNSESSIVGNNSSIVLSNSISSPSSISTSDVAELISEKSYRSFSKDNKNSSNTSHKSRLRNNSKRSIGLNREDSKMNSDNSSNYSESSVPSLSNLSLEIHSE